MENYMNLNQNHTNIYKFDCGCSFPILKDSENGSLPYLNITDELPFCAEVYKMLAEGKTKGVFQLESDLGRTWCKKIKPESEEHMAALGALLRPGCISGDTSIAYKSYVRKD